MVVAVTLSLPSPAAALEQRLCHLSPHRETMAKGGRQEGTLCPSGGLQPWPSEVAARKGRMKTEKTPDIRSPETEKGQAERTKELPIPLLLLGGRKMLSSISSSHLSAK